MFIKKHINLIVVFIAIGLTITSFSSCDKKEEIVLKNTVTISLINAEAANGHYLHARVFKAGETDIENKDKLLATMYVQIKDGKAKFTLQEDDGNLGPNGIDWKPTEWIYYESVDYDIYIYTKSDTENNPPTAAEFGKFFFPFPKRARINNPINIEYKQMTYPQSELLSGTWNVYRYTALFGVTSVASPRLLPIDVLGDTALECTFKNGGDLFHIEFNYSIGNNDTIKSKWSINENESILYFYQFDNSYSPVYVKFSGEYNIFKLTESELHLKRGEGEYTEEILAEKKQ